ncbi:MAG: hypothetical protein RMK29_14450 [Myxococcales bacterium]|nr:hypothetical protein [Myxococcales bacterium]
MPRLLVAALPLAALAALRKTFDVDVFWHLATGKLALSTRSLLPVDPFSFSRAGAPWPYKDLVAAIIFYLGFARLGWAWLAMLKGATVLAIGAALWLAMPAGRRGPLAWLVGLGAYLLAIQYRLSERPILFSLAGYALLLALCEQARHRLPEGRPPHRVLAPLVALLFVWAQLHREVLVGLVTLGALAPSLLAGWLLQRTPLAPLLPRAAPPRTVLVVVGAGGAALLLCLLNPSGAALYRTTLSLARSSLFQELLNEWRSLPPAEMLRTFPATCAVCAVGLLALLLRLVRALRRREQDAPVDLWHLGWWVLLAVLTAGSLRWLPFLAALSALALLLCLAEVEARLCPAPDKILRMGVFILICSGSLLVATNQYEVGLGERPDYYPDDALAFARTVGLRPNVANAFGFGGYIIWHGWPDFRVLVDGRSEQVYPAEFVAACARAQRDPAVFSAMRARDGADWVLAVNRPGQETHRFLAADPAWALVYLSEAAAIYVRAEAYPHLLPLRFRHLRPGAIVEAALNAPVHGPGVSELHTELQRMLHASPTGARANAALALFYHRQGWLAARDRAVARLRALHPDHPGTQAVLQQMGIEGVSQK